MTRLRLDPPPPPAAAELRSARRFGFVASVACLLAALSGVAPAAAVGPVPSAPHELEVPPVAALAGGALPGPAAGEPVADEPPADEPAVDDRGTGGQDAAAPSGRRFRLADPASGRSPWEPREWALSSGVFDVAVTDRAEAGLQVRFAPRLVRIFDRDWSVEPMLGGMVNEDDGYYGYLGLRLPIELGGRWRATPSFGAGIYSAGDGVDLGGPVEFRSGIEVSARLGEHASLGVSYYHLSNGILYDLNPGEESLALVLAVRPGAGP